MPGDIAALVKAAMTEAEGLIAAAEKPWLRERMSDLTAAAGELSRDQLAALRAEGRAMGLSPCEAELRAGWLRKHDPRWAPPAGLSAEERAERQAALAALIGGAGEALRRAKPAPDTPETRAARLEELRKEMSHEGA